LTVKYPVASPTVPILTKEPADCDDANADLALAVSLAKRLGAP
jgi:hypothetical protein